jgi:hypothetical protein
VAALGDDAAVYPHRLLTESVVWAA